MSVDENRGVAAGRSTTSFSQSPFETFGVRTVSNTRLKLDFKAAACFPGEGGENQFNIFPAIFSRQLNFSQAGKLEDLRPNLAMMSDERTMAAAAAADDRTSEKRKCEDFTSLYALQDSTSTPAVTTTPGPTPPVTRTLTDPSGKLSYCFFFLHVACETSFITFQELQNVSKVITF